VEPHPLDGTNVEVVVPGHDGTAQTGHLTMRVYERGVGETRSCGTGAVAAALAARVWGGTTAPDTWVVDVPGGRLEVVVPDQGADGGGGRLLAGPSVELRGPAVIVATGTLELSDLR
jgi:diaminopimelate epimerase